MDNILLISNTCKLITRLKSILPNAQCIRRSGPSLKCISEVPTRYVKGSFRSSPGPVWRMHSVRQCWFSPHQLAFLLMSCRKIFFYSLPFPFHTDAQSSPFIIPSFGRTIISLNPFILSYTRGQIENRYSKAFNIPWLFCVFLKPSDQVRNSWLLSWCRFHFLFDLAFNLS